MPTEPFRYRNQPWKALYLTYVLSIALVFRLPYWLIVSAIPSLRPRQSWTFYRAFVYHPFKLFVQLIRVVGLHPPKGNAERDSQNPEETGFAWVEPLPESLITGDIAEMAKANGVYPVRVWGYWMGERDEKGRPGQPAREGERVLLHIHGES